MISVLLVAALGLGAFEFSEPFDYANGSEGAPVWSVQTLGWEVFDSRMVHNKGPRTVAILEKAPHGKRVEIKATVTVHKRDGQGWAVAGIVFRRDNGNYWHVALCEAPEDQQHRHFVELQESLNGRWLAQSSEKSRLKVLANEGGDFAWEYGTPYRLRLTVTPERIDGFLLGMDGTQRTHFAYAFDGPAVTEGQPALDCGFFHAAFDDVQVRADDPVPPPKETAVKPPPYAVHAAHPNLKAKATGFFRVTQIDGRWWFIDPKGRAFYAVGTDHIRYDGHWCEKLGYAPYGKKMRAKYGSAEKWAETAAGRLSDWGFNTIAAGHSKVMRYRGFAHTEFLSFGSGFAAFDDLCPKTHWTGFPNVFSPRWPRHCDRVARLGCAAQKGDPWLLGYFLDNELEWYGKDHTDMGLFHEAWKKPAEHTAKQAWIALLKEELKTPEEFEKHWGLAVTSFDDLAKHTEPQGVLTKRGRAIGKAWVRLVAERYFAECTRAIRKYDPNHLIIGSRFAGRAPDIWDICGKHCDVVTFNMYPRIDVDLGVPTPVVEQIQEWYAECQRPMMITEWSFPALDAGLPSQHGAGMRVATQTQRAQCFTHFQKLMFSLPFMVGFDFFMFVAEPALGISSTFPEDSNYGLVNEDDVPYVELTQAATDLHARVYALHAAGALSATPEPEQIVGWLSNPPGAVVDGLASPCRLETSGLVLSGPIGGLAWKVSLGESPLADMLPLMHQVTSGDRWIPPDSARITGAWANHRVTVVEMEFALKNAGEAAPNQVRPMRYRTGWRFWIPRGAGEWFASQCLWVQNTDTKAWTLDEVYHYVRPTIGGDPAGDNSLCGSTTNYYVRGDAWIDENVGLGIGAWFPGGSGYQCRFWKDPDGGGGFHGDLRKKVDKELAPGQRWTASDTPVFLFPLRDTTRVGFGAVVDRLRQQVLAKP
jgi:hypothetical protein